MLIAQQVDQLNWAYAATLSVLLLATALVIIAAFYRLPGVGHTLRTSAR
jgi:ABC-type spermidine/putrescine transport system permease subunit I